MICDFTLKNYRCFSDRQPARFQLGRGIHAFVGPNNAGKSSLLRFFFDFRQLFRSLQNWNLVAPLIQNRAAAVNFAFPAPVQDPNEVFFDRNQRELGIELGISWTNEEKAHYREPVPESVKLTIPRGSNSSHIQIWVQGIEVSGSCGLINNEVLQFTSAANVTRRMSWTSMQDVFSSLASTMYVGPFRNAINLGATEAYFDVQAGQAFIKTWKNYKSGTSKANNEACHLLEQQIRRIFGYRDLQINAVAGDNELQILSDGKSYKSADTGAGLLQFVIVLANAATTRRDYVLIDEPELNLHPTLQLDFLTTIGSYAQQGILFATHNVGLARATAERIYSVRRNAGTGEAELRQFEATKNLAELLGEMGFNAYYDLGFSKVLLVEGPTDLKTVQQFLRLLGKEHQILLLPLGGASMINGSRGEELAEIKRVGANVSALIDSEKDAPTAALGRDRQEFIAACSSQGIHCHALELRALENYLTDDAVKWTKGPKYSMLGPYQRLASADPGWGKNENWLIARAMTAEDLIKSDLGKFLSSL